MRKKIALLLGQPEETYQTSFLNGFLTKAFEEDYDVCIFAMYLKHQATKGKERGESTIFTLAEFELFDAVVVLANTIQTQGVLERLEEEIHDRYDGPVIIVDRESNYFSSVAADNYLPVKKLVSHLIEEHGLTDIAFLTGNEFHPHAVQRLQSFIDCMHEHGLEPGENRIFYGDFWFNSGKATAEKLLRDREHLPQAVACANDFMAIGLMEELRKEGVRVPEDVAVTGHDASFVGSKFNFNVTTMPIPAREIGEYCVDYVKAMAEGRKLPKFSAVPDIIIGGSCGCPMEERLPDEKQEEPDNGTSSLFGFNIGLMEENILMQTEKQGWANTVFSYVNQIRPFDGFHLCLNEEWAGEGFGNEIGTKYTDRMVDVLRCGETDKVDLTAVFDRKLLLPELAENSAKPRAYFFTPLYFEEHCFGYAAINYGDNDGYIGGTYRDWLGAVMRGLECFMRVGILQSKVAHMESDRIRDPLTGLYNYKGFMQRVISDMKEAKVPYVCIDAAAIELCGMNEIYMTVGSSAGDKVLVEFSDTMLMSRDQEILCYLGNGEFVAVRITEEETADTALKPFLDNVRSKFEQYLKNNALNGKVEPALGRIQGTVNSEEKLGSLVGEAVGRKNAVKIREQRNESRGMSEEEQKKEELVADILDNNRLIYFFQPIVSASTGEIFAYEALMRADTKEKISPLDILKCAEHLSRLNDVERATFMNVLTYIEDHSEQFENKKIFINSIPGTQMTEEDADRIRKKLTGLSGKIVVELTEQAELGDDELEALKKKYEKLGVDTAVDDYGTGYSNVYNLLRYMPNIVKIDRMLLAGINLSAQKQHFVREIIEFSHNNGITVLAEGVETTEELKMVTAFGVDLIQGYYTARPNAEVISKIDHKVRSEIVQFRQYAQSQSRHKVFHAGQDGSIFLIQLATGHYSKILFTLGDAPHRDVSIIGLPGFQANVEIEFGDSYSGRIELRDVDLSLHNDAPAIKLGNNCDVTLVLSGENTLEQGGILVPESSKLTVEGDGGLRMQQIAMNGYGIGNDKDSKCGELHFEQDGHIEVYGNVIRGVGIGAGAGGKIFINRGRYSIKLTGEEAVGIGSFDGGTDISVKYCAADINIRNSSSVGIGSVKGNVSAEIRYATVNGKFNSRNCVGIGTMHGSSAKVVFSDGIADLDCRSENMCGIGSITGDADIEAANFSVTVSAEGKEAVAMGNHKRTARIHTDNSELSVQVKNKLDFDIGAETFEIVNGRSKFIFNDEEIVRESIEGEM